MLLGGATEEVEEGTSDTPLQGDLDGGVTLEMIRLAQAECLPE